MLRCTSRTAASSPRRSFVRWARRYAFRVGGSGAYVSLVAARPLSPHPCGCLVRACPQPELAGRRPRSPRRHHRWTRPYRISWQRTSRPSVISPVDVAGVPVISWLGSCAPSQRNKRGNPCGASSCSRRRYSGPHARPLRVLGGTWQPTSIAAWTCRQHRTSCPSGMMQCPRSKGPVPAHGRGHRSPDPRPFCRECVGSWMRAPWRKPYPP